jgi:hypothetical protein
MRRIITPVLIIFLLIGILPGSCQAETGATTTALTVQEAIDLAIKNRNDVKTAALDVDAASISNDITWENANDKIAESSDGDQYDSSSSSSWDSVYTSDYNLEVKKKNYDTKVESVKFSVYQKYYAVVSALDSSDAQKLASQKAAQNLKISELRYQLGMDTKGALYSAQQQAVSAQGNYAVAQQTADQKYIALMEYIGLSASQRPTLIRELTYTPLKIPDPEGKFKDIVNGSPSVWLAKRALTLEEMTRLNSESLEGDLSDIELETSEISVITTKDAMLQTTRNMYYNILSVEESYNTTVKSAQAADEALSNQIAI